MTAENKDLDLSIDSYQLHHLQLKGQGLLVVPAPFNNKKSIVSFNYLAVVSIGQFQNKFFTCFHFLLLMHRHIRGPDKNFLPWAPRPQKKTLNHKRPFLDEQTPPACNIWPQINGNVMALNIALTSQYLLPHWPNLAWPQQSPQNSPPTRP